MQLVCICQFSKCSLMQLYSYISRMIRVGEIKGSFDRWSKVVVISMISYSSCLFLFSSNKFSSKIGPSRNLSRLGCTRRTRILVLRWCQEQHCDEIVDYLNNGKGSRSLLTDKFYLIIASYGLTRSKGRLQHAGEGS